MQGTPVVIGGSLAERTVTQVATGGHHSCALTSDGKVWCWGSSYLGALGYGGPGPDEGYRIKPVLVTPTWLLEN